MICNKLTLAESLELYAGVMADNDSDTIRRLCREDLFFLLAMAMKRKDAARPWLYDRIREFEAAPDGYLDLWAREHYKSTIITFAATIQDVLKDPEERIAIFSYNLNLAAECVNQIKTELENNIFLKTHFPDILYANPAREAPRWSRELGLIVKRKTNPRDATITPVGLIEGIRTGPHYSKRVYDDIITDKYVNTPELIQKATASWEQSIHLGSSASGKDVERYAGTRYHLNDTYATLLKRGAAIPRIYPATHNGKADGDPVFLSQEALDRKRRILGPYNFACQMLMCPYADTAMGFREDWISWHYTLEQGKPVPGWNYYITVDGANEKKKTSDYTVMLVIAAAPDGNYYLQDGIRDRLALHERVSALFRLVRLYRPLAVGYEQYGLMADVDHLRGQMADANYHFNITKLGGPMPKNDRIRRLIPIFARHQFYLPPSIRFVNREGQVRDLIRELLDEEFSFFPVGTHDDIMDAMARICDKELSVVFPEYEDYSSNRISTARTRTVKPYTPTL